MIDWDADCLAPIMSVFGQSVVYRSDGPPAAATITIPDAVFDEAYLKVSILSDGSEITSVAPVVGVRASWFVYQGSPFLPSQGDTVDVFNGGTGTPQNDFRQPGYRRYKIINVEPDGHGHILLELNKIGEGAV